VDTVLENVCWILTAIQVCHAWVQAIVERKAVLLQKNVLKDIPVLKVANVQEYLAVKSKG